MNISYSEEFNVNICIRPSIRLSIHNNLKTVYFGFCVYLCGLGHVS